MFQARELAVVYNACQTSEDPYKDFVVWMKAVSAYLGRWTPSVYACLEEYCANNDCRPQQQQEGEEEEPHGDGAAGEGEGHFPAC